MPWRNEHSLLTGQTRRVFFVEIGKMGGKHLGDYIIPYNICCVPQKWINFLSLPIDRFLPKRKNVKMYKNRIYLAELWLSNLQATYIFILQLLLCGFIKFKYISYSVTYLIFNNKESKLNAMVHILFWSLCHFKIKNQVIFALK